MKPPVLTAIVIATLALTTDTLAQTKLDLGLVEQLNKTLVTPDGDKKVAIQIAAATPDQRRALLVALVVTNNGRNNLVKQIAAATPEQRENLLAAVVQIVRDAVDAPIPHSVEVKEIIASFADILRAASDDRATLAALGSELNRIEVPYVCDAIDALSTCRDPKAVKFMAEYGRARMNDIKEWMPRLSPSASEDQKRAGYEPMRSFFSALKGLATSANSSGKAAARELREEFVKLADGSPFREDFLQVINAEIDPLLRVAPQPAPPRSHAPATATKQPPKQSAQPMEPQTSSKAEKPDRPTSSR